MKLLVSGPKRLDIDSYGCIVAYADFLQHQCGEEVVCLTDIGYSPTVPDYLLGLELPSLITVSDYSGYDSLVVIDTSGRDYLAQFYNFDDIIELRDHRMIGDESYRKEKLSDHCHIELVGSCTTLIYEYIKQHGELSKLHPTSLLLLYAGTISNTLNLQGSVTTQRDKDCCQELKSLISLPIDRNRMYFQSIDTTLSADLQKYLALETKHTIWCDMSVTIVQCEVRDADKILSDRYNELLEYMRNYSQSQHRLLTLPSIQDNRNYFLCEDETMQGLLYNFLGARFDNDRGITDKLRLRKEILSFGI